MKKSDLIIKLNNKYQSLKNMDLDWENTFPNPWAPTDEDANSGIYSLKSGTIGDNQSTSVSVTLDVTQDGEIEFFYRVSAEYSPSGTGSIHVPSAASHDASSS